MSLELDHVIGRARAFDGAWNPDRATRVRSQALRTHATRTRRTRALGRGLIGGTSAACIILALLRIGSAGPAASRTVEPASPRLVASESEALATRGIDDAGYTRD